MRVIGSFNQGPHNDGGWAEVLGVIVGLPLLLFGGLALLFAAFMLLTSVGSFFGGETGSIASIVGGVVAQNAISGFFAGAAIALLSPFSRSKFARGWISAFFDRELAEGPSSGTYWGGVALDGTIGMFVGLFTGMAGYILNPLTVAGDSSALAVVTYTFLGGGPNGPGSGGGGPPGSFELTGLFFVIIAAAIIVGVLAGGAVQIALMVLGGAVKGGMEASVARHPLGEGIGHGVRVSLIIGLLQALVTTIGVHNADFSVLYRLAFPQH